MRSGSTPGLAYNAEFGESARFYSPIGVGLDDDGNLYVASGTRVDIRKFAPLALPEQSWDTESVWTREPDGEPARVPGVLATHDGIAFDDSGTGARLYTTREVYDFDPLRPSGSEWGLRGISWPFDLQPATPRPGELPIVRTIDGRRYLFVLSVGGQGRWQARSTVEQHVDVYQLTNDIAVPAARLSIENTCHINDGLSGSERRMGCVNDPNCFCDVVPGDPGNLVLQRGPAILKLWVDQDGDGQVDALPDNSNTDHDESCFTQPGGGMDYVGCTVDPFNRNVAGQVAVLEDTGARPKLEQNDCQQPGFANHQECKNPAPPSLITGFTVDRQGSIWLAFTANGEFGRSGALWRLARPAGSGVNYRLSPVYPEPGAARFIYNKPSSYSVEDVRVDASDRLYLLGRATGAFAVSRYTSWQNGTIGGTLTSFALPFPITDPNFMVPATQNTSSSNWLAYPSFDLAGDKLFVGERYGPIHVYDTTSTAEVARLIPGPEVSGFQIFDEAKGVRATRLNNGEYLVLSHGSGDARGREILYRWATPKPPGQTTGQFTWYSSGLPAGSNPRGIAAGPDGNLWFTMLVANRIGKITTAGAIMTFPTLPTRGSSSAGPTDIVTGPDGNLWFTEWGSSRIGCMTTNGSAPNGTAAKHLDLPLGSSPRSISVGPDGKLWFTESGTYTIARLEPRCDNPAAGALDRWNSPTTQGGPWDIAAGANGDLWFTEQTGNKLARITVQGGMTSFPLPSGSNPTGVAAFADGSVWFSATPLNTVGRWKDGALETPLSLAGLTSPNGIAEDLDGNRWVAGTGGVTRITPAGVVQKHSSTGSPFRIAAGPDGNLWVTDPANNRIGRVYR